MFIFINVNVHVYSPISREFTGLTTYIPRYWNALFKSCISSQENSAFEHFAEAIANKSYFSFVSF